MMFESECATCKKPVTFKGMEPPPDGEVTIEQAETKEGGTGTLVSGIVHVAYCPDCSRQNFLDNARRITRKRG